MANKCETCGAEFESDGSAQCQERFELCLSKDYEQFATYGSVHHLIGACYMLQHNAYSSEGWLETRKMLLQTTKQGMSPEAWRKQNRPRLDSGHRTWKFRQGAKISAVDAISWTRTIADVRLDNAQVYCADAKEWARSVLADTESIVQK